MSKKHKLNGYLALIRHPRPKYIGGGLSRQERKIREPFKYIDIKQDRVKYLVRDLGNCNIQVLVNKAINKKKGKLPYQHLIF